MTFAKKSWSLACDQDQALQMRNLTPLKFYPVDSL